MKRFDHVHHDDPALAEVLLRPQARQLVGTPGDDRLRGGALDDVIDASQGGNDGIDGGKGDDIISLGATLTADDLVKGGAGDDTLVLDGDYRAGIDLDRSFVDGIESVRFLPGHSYAVAGLLNLRDGNDGSRFDGSLLGAGDVLHLDASGSRADGIVLLGGAGDDVLIAGRGQLGDLQGGAGDDVLDGSRGLYGDLDGGVGDDVLTGGKKNCELTGGEGSDILTVASGQTVCRYVSSADSTRADPDLIVGFRRGALIDLRQVDANVTRDGDQAFHFGATPTHTGDLVVRYDAALDLTIVRAFTDGDAKPDMVIHLQGNVPLTPADFAL